MELEELKRKARNKEIKLEDLDVEDILKFSSDRNLMPALREYFGLSDYEINKIRRLKGISNAEIEDFIRDIIVLYNFVNNEYPSLSYYFVNMVIPIMVSAFGSSRGKLDCYTKKVNEIDWENMNPKQEIIKRKIDVKFREEKRKEFKFILETSLLQVQKEKAIFNEKNYNPIYDEEYNPKPKAKKAKGEYNGKRSNRDNSIKERAIEKAHYLCEIDNNHKTFISKSTGKIYGRTSFNTFRV